MTLSKKYLFLLCYWEMMKGTNKDGIEVLLMQTNKQRDMINPYIDYKFPVSYTQKIV